MSRIRQSWRNSFQNAYEGIIQGLQEERNLRFHFVAAIVVLLVCCIFQLQGMKLLFILLAISLVIVAELFNTAIERMIDLTTPYTHPLARVAKDTAAAAVLVTAVFAIGAGVILLGEPISLLLQGNFSKMKMTVLEQIWITSSVVLMILMLLHGTYFRTRAEKRPHLGLSLVFSNALQLFLLTNDVLAGILGSIVSIGCFIWIGFKERAEWRRSLSGAIMGILLAFFTYLLSNLIPG